MLRRNDPALDPLLDCFLGNVAFVSNEFQARPNGQYISYLVHGSNVQNVRSKVKTICINYFW